MQRFVKHGVPAFIALSTILWAAENLYFMKHASARARQACVQKEAKFAALFDGPNSYYWCLRRVEAGGMP
ncbi:MAG: hypothetical protein QOD11_1387 [Bradyrhizobium sp.]|jgi:hypothetical protein|nr:hypothetical protein [Bradyrhizobium sp.]